MNKSTHFSGQPMYGQLINLLDKQKVLNFSRSIGSEKYVKSFDAWQHLLVMLYAVIKRLDSLLLMVVQKRIKNRSWSYSGLATMIRIILMYYINCYSFLNNPDRDWENLIERSKEQPIQLSLFK